LRLIFRGGGRMEVVRAQEEILKGVDEGGLKNPPSNGPGSLANVRRNLDRGERRYHQAWTENTRRRT
jgi:hypothetical protein